MYCWAMAMALDLVASNLCAKNVEATIPSSGSQQQISNDIKSVFLKRLTH